MSNTIDLVATVQLSVLKTQEGILKAERAAVETVYTVKKEKDKALAILDAKLEYIAKEIEELTKDPREEQLKEMKEKVETSELHEVFQEAIIERLDMTFKGGGPLIHEGRDDDTGELRKFILVTEDAAPVYLDQEGIMEEDDEFITEAMWKAVKTHFKETLGPDFYCCVVSTDDQLLYAPEEKKDDKADDGKDAETEV
jgi:hypothetical protein